MKSDLELVSEAYTAIAAVTDRWSALGIPLSVLPQDLSRLFIVDSYLLSAQERLKDPRVQETIKAFAKGDPHGS